MATLIHKGTASAYIPATSKAPKHYVKIGQWFTDDTGRIVLRVDSLPAGYKPWEGYVNLFEKDEAGGL